MKKLGLVVAIGVTVALVVWWVCGLGLVLADPPPVNTNLFGPYKTTLSYANRVGGAVFTAKGTWTFDGIGGVTGTQVTNEGVNYPACKESVSGAFTDLYHNIGGWQTLYGTADVTVTKVSGCPPLAPRPNHMVLNFNGVYGDDCDYPYCNENLHVVDTTADSDAFDNGTTDVSTVTGTISLIDAE